MRRLNLTRDAFTLRLGCSRRALDTWLLPDDSREHRRMPDMARRFVEQILRDGAASHTHRVHTHKLRDAFSIDEGHHFLSVDQLDRATVGGIFDLADRLEPVAQRRSITRILEGAVLANLFFEASTRTRVSFGAAFCRLGGSVCDTTGFTFSSMAKGESIADTARVVSGYVDALVIRHPDLGAVREFAAATHVPVINGGDGPGEHPSQALLDLYTIQREFGRIDKLIDGAHVAMVGDLRNGRTVHSLARLLSLYEGMTLSFVAPPSLQMPDEVADIVAARGHAVRWSSTLEEGIEGADVVYATRIQRERLTDERIEGYGPEFIVNQRAIDAACGPDTVLMHPLPRDSRPDACDLSTDLDADPRLAIFRQTDNGIPVRMALFAILLGVEHLVGTDFRQAPWQRPERLGPNDRPVQEPRALLAS